MNKIKVTSLNHLQELVSGGHHDFLIEGEYQNESKSIYIKENELLVFSSYFEKDSLDKVQASISAGTFYCVNHKEK